MLMHNSELEQIERRALLFTRQGDRDALRPEDVTAMLAEIREARQTVRHLIAELREAQGWQGWWRR